MNSLLPKNSTNKLLCLTFEDDLNKIKREARYNLRNKSLPKNLYDKIDLQKFKYNENYIKNVLSPNFFKDILKEICVDFDKYITIIIASRVIKYSTKKEYLNKLFDGFCRVISYYSFILENYMNILKNSKYRYYNSFYMNGYIMDKMFEDIRHRFYDNFWRHKKEILENSKRNNELYDYSSFSIYNSLPSNITIDDEGILEMTL